MFKLIAVTLAAFYFVLLTFGDGTERSQDVTRSEPLSISLVQAAAFAQADHQSSYVSPISDRAAIEMALAAGAEIRAKARTVSRQDRVVASDVAAEAAIPTPENPLWYVTGSRVNLRGGPGTSNAVVAQVTFGTEAEVLGQSDGWYQIRISDGSVAGWIFGRFLDAQRPG